MAARQQVFNTAELLELVLLKLDDESLLLSQRVSLQFRDTIAASPKIQEQLHLRPVALPKSDKGFHWRCNTLFTKRTIVDAVGLEIEVKDCLPHYLEVIYPDEETLLFSLNNEAATSGGWKNQVFAQPVLPPYGHAADDLDPNTGLVHDPDNGAEYIQGSRGAEAVFYRTRTLPKFLVPGQTKQATQDCAYAMKDVKQPWKGYVCRADGLWESYRYLESVSWNDKDEIDDLNGWRNDHLSTARWQLDTCGVKGGPCGKSFCLKFAMHRPGESATFFKIRAQRKADVDLKKMAEVMQMRREALQQSEEA